MNYVALTRDEITALQETAKYQYRLEPLGSCGHRLEKASKDILRLSEDLTAAYDRVEHLEDLLT